MVHNTVEITMSTELQQIASRANGAKSHGPVTKEGKQASSQNSRKHGLLSKRVVLEGESQEEFDALLASFLEEHQPQTPTEAALIENMAVARWRQQRVWSLETTALDHQIRRPKYMEGDDFPTQAFVAFRTLADEGRSLELLNRYDTRFERQFRAALTALLNLQAKRPAVNSVHAPRPDQIPDARGIHVMPSPPAPEPDAPALPETKLAAAAFTSLNHPSGSFGRIAFPGSAAVSLVILLLTMAGLGSVKRNPPHARQSSRLLHPCYTTRGRTC